ncbi:hypothetical protein TcCL_ESM02520 [Trypanosoma cruzi]|nr:hypothetical protein TcCL_ESM02520 [Trypanosoma cruzi]
MPLSLTRQAAQQSDDVRQTEEELVPRRVVTLHLRPATAENEEDRMRRVSWERNVRENKNQRVSKSCCVFHKKNFLGRAAAMKVVVAAAAAAAVTKAAVLLVTTTNREEVMLTITAVMEAMRAILLLASTVIIATTAINIHLAQRSIVTAERGFIKHHCGVTRRKKKKKKKANMKNKEKRTRQTGKKVFKGMGVV